ncbi:hypothetical protein OA179_00360 [Candidatus Pelagibacter sp.]|nr:hypothetical protein [Candidatus Pelagibacter sp.]
MKTILIMPVKKNSSRLKNKNILPILDKPMFIYTLFEAMKCKFINKFYVSTESEQIIKICKYYKVNFIKRPKRLSKKNTEKQEVIVNTLNQLKQKKIIPNVVISLQANSPELKKVHLEKAFKFFIKKLHPNAPIKELITINSQNIQDAAFRIMTYKAAFQKTLSTKLGVFRTNLTDIHTKKDYLSIKKKIEKKRKKNN